MSKSDTTGSWNISRQEYSPVLKHSIYTYTHTRARVCALTCLKSALRVRTAVRTTTERKKEEVSSNRDGRFGRDIYNMNQFGQSGKRCATRSFPSDLWSSSIDVYSSILSWRLLWMVRKYVPNKIEMGLMRVQVEMAIVSRVPRRVRTHAAWFINRRVSLRHRSTYNIIVILRLFHDMRAAIRK